MNYLFCKLKFQGEVHIGNGSLTDARYTIGADTLFSALCHEALKSGGESSLTYLVVLAKTNKFRISDGFPYIGDTYYIPRPLVWKDHWKKLDFVPMEALDWLPDHSALLSENEEVIRFQKLGRTRLRTNMSRQKGNQLCPYYVGTYQFYRGNGIYFIIGYEEPLVLEFIKNQLSSLQYTGIGGKKSSGLGLFWFEFQEIQEDYIKHLDRKPESRDKWNMTLSVSLPKVEEEDYLSDALYTKIKKKGYIYSENYTSEMYDEDDILEKRELNIVKAGACVRRCYDGQIANVNNNKGHDVYRYALPIYWRLPL